MKKIEKMVVVFLLATNVVTLLLSLKYCSTKLLDTLSVLLTITGILQLELTGFFDDMFVVYSDEKKFPFGPPSSISRELIEELDTAFGRIKSLLFYNRKIGVLLFFISSILQLVLIWVR